MLAIRNRIKGEQGFTLVEVTIILLVLVIISMIMLPQLGNFNRLARKVKVSEDLGAICATLKKFLDEVQVNAFWENPGGGTAAPSGDRIGLLVGPGNVPDDGPDTAANHNINAPANGVWQEVPDQGATTPIDVDTDAPGTAASSIVFSADYFENHLQINDPYGDASAGATTRYNNTSENSAADFFLSWKGPYFDMFTPDPWGNRYMSNVFALHTLDTAFEYYTSAVVCISAGPDGRINTVFNQPMDQAPWGWVTAGDDVAVVLSAGGPF